MNITAVILLSLCTLFFSCSDNSAHHQGLFSDDKSSNQRPTALAGHDLRVTENSMVRLNGAAIDVDGHIKNMAWRQVSRGLDIVFNPSSRSDISFVAPKVDQDQVVTFELSVIDDKDAITTDTVNVLIMK